MTQPTAGTAPDSPLLAFVLAALTGMVAPTLIDLGLAERAAREAVAPYQARGETDWLAIGQIVGFALSVLDTLRLSMAADTPAPLKLKLRGNANAANRAVRDTTEMLAKACRATTTPAPASAPPAEAEPSPPALTSEDWARGMRTMAVKLEAQAATVSPEQRKIDAMWIAVLNGMSGETAAAPKVPNAGKAALLRSTWMASDPGIPAHFLRGGKRARG